MISTIQSWWILSLGTVYLDHYSGLQLRELFMYIALDVTVNPVCETCVDAREEFYSQRIQKGKTEGGADISKME